MDSLEAHLERKIQGVAFDGNIRSNFASVRSTCDTAAVVNSALNLHDPARPLELPVSFTLDTDIKDRVRAATGVVDLLGS